MKTGNCFNKEVDIFDLVVSEETDFDLTRKRVYVVKGVSGDLIRITNDKGVTDFYADEYFRFYEGE